MLTFFTGTMVRRGAKEQEGAAQTENPGTKFPIPNQNDISRKSKQKVKRSGMTDILAGAHQTARRNCKCKCKCNTASRSTAVLSLRFPKK